MAGWAGTGVNVTKNTGYKAKKIPILKKKNDTFLIGNQVINRVKAPDPDTSYL